MQEKQWPWASKALIYSLGHMLGAVWLFPDAFAFAPVVPPVAPYYSQPTPSITATVTMSLPSLVSIVAPPPLPIPTLVPIKAATVTESLGLILVPEVASASSFVGVQTNKVPGVSLSNLISQPVPQQPAPQQVGVTLSATTVGSPTYAPSAPVWADGTPDTAASPLATLASPFSADDELYIDVLLNGNLVRQGIVAYLANQPGQYWLPLGEIISMANFQVKLDAAAGQASGWLTSEDETFGIDLANQKLERRGTVFKLNAADVRLEAGELYVLASRLEEWLPLRFALDVNELRLAIVSTVKLTAEEQAERAKAWESLSRAKELERQLLLQTAQVIPRSSFSDPQFSVNASTNFNHAQAGENTLGVATNVQGAGEVLYGTGVATLGLDHRSQQGLKLTDATLSWRRQELFPSLLGPLKATNAVAGDIDFIAAPLTGLPSQGRGVRLNNLPYNYVPDPDQFVLQGEAPVGWDIEVYQNQSLLAFTRVGNTGRYSFNALPLKAGLNLFRVLEHGPQGQKRERTQRYFLGEGQTAKGELLYDATLLQPNQKVIETGTATSNSPGILAHNRFSYGLTNNLAASLGTFASTGGSSTLPSSGISTGLRGSYGSVFGLLDVARNSTGDTGLAISVRSSLGNDADLRLGYDTTTTGAIRRQTWQADLGYTSRLGAVGLDQGLGYRQIRTSGQAPEQALSHRASLGYGRVALTNSLDYLWGPQTHSITGSLDSTARIANQSFQLGLTYQPEASEPLQTARLNFKLPLTEAVALDNTLRHTLTPQTKTQLESTLRYDLGPYALGLSSNADNNGNFGLGLTASVQLMPEGKGRYSVQHPSSGSSLASARVMLFADSNSNGVKEPTEKPAVGIVVRNLSRGTSEVTDAEGIARINNITPYAPVRLELDEESFPDIFLRYSGKPLVVVGHPGADGLIIVPLQQFGEISGFAIQQAGTNTLPAAGVILEAVDTSGSIIDYTTTEADGYFVLAPLPLGTYTLRSQAAAASITGLVATPQTIELKPKDFIQSDIELKIETKSLPPPLEGIPPDKQGNTLINN